MTQLVNKEFVTQTWGWAFENGVKEVIKVSRFGNVLLHSGDEIYQIVTEDCEVKKVCEDYELDNLDLDEKFKEEWEMASWQEMAKNRHGELPNGKVIAFITPRTLGGQDNADNMYYADPTDYIGGFGQIAKQIKDLPDGAQIVLKVK